MRIVPITDLVYADPKPATPEEGRAKHNAIMAGLNAPVFLGTFNGLEYDLKGDRYAARFTPGQGKKLTLKASNEVADFMAQHAAGLGFWQGRMEAGLLVDVYLVYA